MRTHHFLICFSLATIFGCKKNTIAPKAAEFLAAEFTAEVNGSAFANATSLERYDYMNDASLTAVTNSGIMKIMLQSPVSGGIYSVSSEGPNRIFYANLTDTFYCSSGNIKVVKYISDSVFRGDFSGTGTLIENGESIPLTIIKGQFNFVTNRNF